MSKISFVFTREMAENLKKVREKAGLSQIEVANRIGLRYKTADSFISHLEKGRIKNPSLGAILLYIKACGVSWSDFFKQLDVIDFKLRHEKMVSQLPLPPEPRKVERAAMKYEIGIEFPSKEKEEIDFERLKKRIKDKVIVLVNKEEVTLTPALSHKGRGGVREMTAYQKFALEYFDFLAVLNKAGMKMVTDKYLRTGLKFNLIAKIKKIINSVLRAEIKRISAQKPLPTKKQEKMAIGFTKYRIIIERIEAEVHKLLCEMEVQTPWFALYKDFSRQCYQALKKYHNKDTEKLAQSLKKLNSRWQNEGLKQDVLLKLNDRVVAIFTDLKMKRLV